MENTRFPGFSEKQVQWLEDKTAHLEGFAKTQAQQELYRKLLPQVQGKQFQEQRQELKNQVYYKAQQSQNPAFVKKTEVDLRKEDLADFAKQKHGLKPQLNTKQVFDGIVKEAQARNINMQSLNSYLNNGEETFLYEMGFKQAPTRQGGIKGIASSIAGDWGWGERINPIGKITETIDDLVQKIPTLSEEEWDQFAREKLGGFGEGMGILPAIIANTMPSLLKTATGTVRGITNPFDTAYGLGTLVGTEEGRGMLKNRYWDDLKKTATEDPVGLASDFLTLVAGGAGAVSKVSNISSKAAKLGKLSNTASKLSSVATEAGDFAKMAGGAADLGLDVLHNGMLGKLSEAIGAKSGLTKGGLKYLQYTQKPLQSLSDFKEGVIKSLDKHLIDERTKKALENNPYIVKWWQKTKNYIDDNGLSPESKKEINASHIQELGSEILDLIAKRKESLSESGKGYEEIRNQNQIFDNSITKPKLDYFLEEKGIKVKDGVLDFEDSTVVKDADMKAIQRAYEWIIRPEYDTKSGLAQRRKLDQLAYPDGKPSEGTKIIKGMRKVFDTTMKESISGLKEVDDNFSQQIQALNEIQEGLVYKDGARKGEIRDNFNQIINTLDGPNRAVMAERLNQLRPGLLEEIQAVHHMKKLTDAYYKTPVMWKSMLAKGGGMILGGVGGAGHGPLGVVAGALAGFFAEKGLSKYSQSRVQKMIDGLGKEAKMKLEKIGGKLEADKELTPKEDSLMQEIAEKLQDQKNLPQEEGLGKLREGAETRYQLAEPIKSENFKKWFGDWENDPKNASKVVDAEGKPLVVYHSSNAKRIRIFNTESASWFTPSEVYSKAFSEDGGKTYKAYLNIKNPIYVGDIDGLITHSSLEYLSNLTKIPVESLKEMATGKYLYTITNSKKFKELMIEKGYDGIEAREGRVKSYGVFGSNQIKSATDNIGTFDANNPDIRYQKHGVANPLEKEVSAQRATQLENIRNGRSVQELADHYGIDIKTVETITTPEGLKAYGKYGDGIITLAEKIKEGTAPHELFHATFDLVDQARKETLLEGIMKEKKLDKVQAEEFLADNFSEYFRTGRLKGEKVIGNVGRTLGAKLMQSVKAFFQKVKEWLIGASKNKAQIKKLFDEILDGEIKHKESIVGNKVSFQILKQEFPDLKEVGEGEFGTIYEGVKGTDAEQLLIKQQGGEVRGAYTFEKKPVDLIRGSYNKRTESGIGLSKISQKHPEVLGKIQDLLDTLPILKRDTKEIVLGDKNSVVVIKLQYLDQKKRWIMTAYDRKGTKKL